ncbi:MAG: AsnC family transcriptional regulator [Dehalococcoidia bacterium]
MAKWALLTNHALVLLHVAEHPNSTLREIAHEVGITERATHSILRALDDDRIISRRKDGRRNQYRVDLRAVMEYQRKMPYTVERIVTWMANLARQLEGEDSESPGPELGSPEANPDDDGPPDDDDSRGAGSL